MTLDTVHFTPLLSLIGGMMIGVAALILMIKNKAIMGVSGITRQAMINSDRLWRIAFVVSIIIGAATYLAFIDTDYTVTVTGDSTTLIAGGLIVGLGTAIGNGCTSGHGVCGLSRFSKRSLASVIIFMATAMITTFLLK